jgi:hypothetical protein
VKSLTTLTSVMQHNALFRLYKRNIIDCVLILKRHGIKELVRQRGWRFAVLIGAYYLVRDTVVYVAIPWCVARGLL